MYLGVEIFIIPETLKGASVTPFCAVQCKYNCVQDKLKSLNDDHLRL